MNSVELLKNVTEPLMDLEGGEGMARMAYIPNIIKFLMVTAI